MLTFNASPIAFAPSAWILLLPSHRDFSELPSSFSRLAIAFVPTIPMLLSVHDRGDREIQFYQTIQSLETYTVRRTNGLLLSFNVSTVLLPFNAWANLTAPLSPIFASRECEKKKPQQYDRNKTQISVRKETKQTIFYQFLRTRQIDAWNRCIVQWQTVYYLSK